MRVAADANVLLAAVIGGRAKLILEHRDSLSIFTTQNIVDEVQEYALVLAQKKRIAEEIALLAVAALPITVVERAVYAKKLPEAMKRIGRRDPDDAELLALAMHMRISLWSNDRDFENTGVELLTTEDLLRELGIIG